MHLEMVYYKLKYLPIIVFEQIYHLLKKEDLLIIEVITVPVSGVLLL
jgi:hypothetical protein